MVLMVFAVGLGGRQAPVHPIHAAVQGSRRRVLC